ncbi:MAG: hypothetical protein RID07_01575, partial [Lacipirellulaceae bacterium]
LILGVMLTSQERFVEMKTMAGDWVLGFIAGSALLATLAWVAFSVPEWRGIDRAAAEELEVEATVAPLAMGLLGARTDGGSEQGYLLFFEVVSVHLLVVLVGAAYLARAKMKRGTAEERTTQVEPGAALPN